MMDPASRTALLAADVRESRAAGSGLVRSEFRSEDNMHWMLN